MVWLSIACFVAGTALTVDERASALGLEGFEKWRLVNEQPYMMSAQIGFLCRGPSPEERRLLKTSPHADYYNRVYVSANGTKPMIEGGTFPEGTKIVKRKLKDWNRNEAVMSTFMIKRKKGFNPDCGDWEFGTLDATGKRVTSHGKLDNCMSCHVDQKKKDFTFRTYLPLKRSR
ncbi:MAG TPA: cytochrome P460 family protein [Fimbriimonadaceae bacterium]|nr:cytochrome P460 family protein [Fimbriimonadaceae bacterium]